MTNRQLSSLLPGLNRMTVGFDDLWDRAASARVNSYPPYNIAKLNDENFEITLAVAGFSKDELTVTAQPGKLTIKGHKEEVNDPTNFVYFGIATRDFDREFKLDLLVEVTGVSLENGLLTVFLEKKIPEEKKPKILQIK